MRATKTRSPYQVDGMWWYNETDGACGPYDTQAAAMEDERGTRRSSNNLETPGYWTTDDRRKN